MVLFKADVPGASLNGRNPADLTVSQLKHWLQCHDASTNGEEGQFSCQASLIHCLMYHSYNSVYPACDFKCYSCCFHRVQAYIKHSWSSKIIDPDGKTKDPSSKVSSSLSLPHQTNENCSWQPLKHVFAEKEPCQALSYTNAQIIN